MGVFLALGGLHMPLQVASPGVEIPQQHLYYFSCLVTRFDDMRRLRPFFTEHT